MIPTSFIHINTGVDPFNGRTKKGVVRVSAKEGFEKSLLEWQIRADMSQLVAYWTLKGINIENSN
jgi:hypothetical protein